LSGSDPGLNKKPNTIEIISIINEGITDVKLNLGDSILVSSDFSVF